VLRDAMLRSRPFVRDEGTVTVEFMLWLPLIFTIILFTVDVALIYLKQADMWNVARDISRRLSVSDSYTNASAQTDAQNQLFTSLSSATITATGGTVAGQDKVVTIQIPLCNASLFRVVGCYDNTLNLTARVTMASEY
jgi:Flp pilus assembly protein TadG